MRRLIPADDAATTVEEAYSAPLGSHERRPWVGLCMVTSIDGSTVVDGMSAQLSSINDSAVLHRLRSLADMIIVGAGTVRAEGYRPPNKVGQRIGVVTGSGHVDVDAPLFRTGAGFLITTERAVVPTGIDVVRAGLDRVDFVVALTRLADVCESPTFVQAEGGAGLNGALFTQDVIDEINVTTSPLTVGGIGPRMSTGGDDHAHQFTMAQLVVDDQSFVYSRWLRTRR